MESVLYNHSRVHIIRISLNALYFQQLYYDHDNLFHLTVMYSIQKVDNTFFYNHCY